MATYGMEFSDIYTRIKDYANINNVTSADTKAKRAANDALRLIASLRNWDILKRESTITPITSTQAYAILTGTTDFDHLVSCWYLSNGIPIYIDVLDDSEWREQVQNVTDGTPQVCRTTRADGTLKLQFSPRPSASFVALYTTIYFDYIKKPTELSGDTDIPNIPDTSQQMAIVYLAVADLLAKQGDLNGTAAYEIKANRMLNLSHKLDDKKKGSAARLGRPLVPIGSTGGIRVSDYK